MKTLTSEWLAGRATAPGLLGCGIGEPNGDWLCQCADAAGCPTEKLEQIIPQLTEAGQWLASDDRPPQSHTWTFAEGKIRAVTRPDGWTLVAVTRADAAAAQTLDALTAEFLALGTAN